jgi:two-component system, LytTR family, sensor kinase
MITTNYYNKRLLLLIPLIGLLILAIFVLSYGLKEVDMLWKQIIYSILNTAMIWLGCIVIVQFLWKKYPWEQHPVRHLVLEIVLITTYTLLVSSLNYVFSTRFLHEQIAGEDIGISIAITLLITYLITGIHEGVYFYQQWKYNFSKSVRLERDNMEARYEALRAQINPHFLFNSLNGLVNVVENNKQAVDYIHNLSDLLRYMLKSNEKELVLLRDEMAVLDNYIKLQQLRFRNTLKVDIDVSESHFHYAVPPLSLQMLVENAIKHNVITQSKPLHIEIGTEKDTIFVKNNLQKKEVIGSTGQGLKNISGRYRLFSAKPVRIEETNGYFRVTLPLLQVEL